ncbi:hypothetical protein [Streptomyces sp. NPDC002209]|uniref:hypothetical protein n=1 Tax=Streptomyces sp. NPDC002209 TaxID=3364638 RepID=UPI0036A97580
MDMDQAGRTGAVALDVARFDYAPAAADYDKAMWRFSLRTRPGLTGSLLLPAVFAAAAFAVRVVAWRFDGGQILIAAVPCVIALFAVRQWVRRSRARAQYEDDAARGTCRTTLTEEGLTTTGPDGEGNSVDWRAYPWWFETPELFVLTGSLEHVFVLPKRGAAAPEDLVRARALFARHLRRI